MASPFVREMWGPADDDEDGVVDPSWQDVSDAIDRLGEPGYTMLLLAGEEETPHLCVGGGREGRYILYVMHSDGKFYSAVDPDGGEEPVEVITGGDLREFPSKMCIGEAAVLRATRTFFQTGDLANDVPWTDQ